MRRRMVQRRGRAAVALTVLLGLPVLLTGCSRGPSASFDLQATNQSLALAPGGNAGVALVLAPQGGFTGSVSLALLNAQGKPALGFSVTPGSVNVTGGTPTLASVTIAASGSVPVGRDALLLEASGGGASASLPLQVTVQANPSPDFSLALSPIVLSTTPGVKATTELVITSQNGFAGTVSLSLTNGSGTPPVGFSVSPTSVTVAAGQSAGQALTVSTGSYLTDGTYQLTLVASGNGVTHTIPLTLVLSSSATGTFQKQTTYTVGSNPLSVAVGDFNGDGKPDLAVANSSGGTVSVLLGNGDGTFQTQTTYTVGSSSFPFSVAVGDFNGDGNPDLAVANAGSGTVSVLLGNGDGTFQTQTTYTVGSTPASVAVGDFNGDGNPDLAITNAGSGTVSVLLGNGDGTFQTQTTYTVGSTPRSVAVGDFNGDGKPDLAVANSSGGTVSVLLGQ